MNIFLCCFPRRESAVGALTSFISYMTCSVLHNETMVIVLSVGHSILHSRISDPHEVVQTYQGQHEMFRIVWSLMHCRQETSEAIGEDAKLFSTTRLAQDKR